MAPEKTEGPYQILTFAGIELDCIKNKARLPKEKVEESLSAIRISLGRRKVSLKELQSLLGLLNFACSVVVPGRVFLRRLINLTIGVHQSHHLIRLTLEVKKDLKIWETFLDSFNGKSFFLEEGWASSDSLCFSLMQQNLVAMALFLVNSEHMVNGQTPGKTTTLVSLSFFQSS